MATDRHQGNAAKGMRNSASASAAEAVADEHSEPENILQDDRLPLFASRIKRMKHKKERGKKRNLLIWEVLEQTNNRWIDEHMHEEEEGGSDKEEPLEETMDASPDMLVTLLPHQKEFLAWALKQEKSNVKGGILADEMGTGKTIEAISLVLTARSLRWGFEVSSANGAPSAWDDVLPTVRCTLVICTKASLPQWENMIQDNTKEGSVKVLTYYGCNRPKDALHFGDYDLVLTTYKTVLMPFISMGPEGNDSKPLSKAPLHSVKWERIILDEAHVIKRKEGKIARAVFLLESLYRWALTGTPLQNSAGDLYSLVRFLQVQPYSFHFCQFCDCSKLDFESKCNCAHDPKSHFAWWNNYITWPVQSSSDEGYRKRTFVLLKGKVLKSMLLMRTKKGRAAEIVLPPRIVSLRLDSLNQKEREYYKTLYGQSLEEFDFQLSQVSTQSYSLVLQIISKLQQATNHQYLVNKKAIDSCLICHDSAEDPLVAPCKHVFCKSCYIKYSEAPGSRSCPSCSELVGVLKEFRHSSILNRINLEQFETSTKIDALREEIRNMVEQDISAKGIVFSQFTSFLDLISYSLHKAGIKSVQLVGTMTSTQQRNAIKTFSNDPHCKVILMSLKAGGLALNMTVASHVFLMDPWWSRAVELQAQDRIHRIGQYKPIRVIRFVIRDTIEEGILRLQEKKQLVFEGTLSSTRAMSKLTLKDFSFLFQKTS